MRTKRIGPMMVLCLAWVPVDDKPDLLVWAPQTTDDSTGLFWIRTDDPNIEKIETNE